MALIRKNKIPPYYTTSAADTIKETLAYLHVDTDWLANKMNLSHEKMHKALNREDYLTMDQFKQVQASIGVPARLLWNLDSNFIEHSRESSIIKSIHDIQRGNYTTVTHYLPPAGEVRTQEHEKYNGHIDWDKS